MGMDEIVGWAMVGNRSAAASAEMKGQLIAITSSGDSAEISAVV
jgi:hypothetical protein